VGDKPERVIAIYPGSFDPFTNGHLDLIERSTHLFDTLVISVLQNEKKEPLFSVEERKQMIEQSLPGHNHIEVDSFNGLLVDYASAKGASAILRGIRAISDYEYELQMALMNRRLRPDIETVFLMAGEAYSFISSRMVKEVASLGGRINGLVPPAVEQKLREKFEGV
jgi:pantetheine-phosphate adenylyltransferase